MENLGDADLQMVTEKAASGDSDFMFELAKRLRLGIGVAADPSAAFDCYLKAAEKDHVRGMFMAGVCYRDGYGVPPNDDEAARWFKRAADRRHPVAMYNYCKYLSRSGNARDIEKSRHLLESAADMNHVPSLHLLALTYWYGHNRRGINKDPERAIALAKRAALLGSTYTQHNLGNYLYEMGEIEDAYIWYKISGGKSSLDMCEVIRKKVPGIAVLLDPKIRRTRAAIQQNVREISCRWWRDDDEFTEHVIIR